MLPSRLFPQKELVDYCKEQGIVVVAHQPLGGVPVGAVRAQTDVKPPLHHQEIHDIASRCGKTPAQVCLSWAVQRGIPVIPKTVNKGRMGENLELTKLSAEAFETVNKLVDKHGPVRFLDSSRHIGFDIFDEEHDQPV